MPKDDLRIDLGMDEKDLRTIFLYEFKLGHSAAEVSRTINRVYGRGTTNEEKVEYWFERFRHGDESLIDHFNEPTTSS